MSNVNASEIKIGNVIAFQGGKYRVISMEHVKPGKGGAFQQMEMKEIKIGTKLNQRFRSDEKLDRVETETKEFQFLFLDGDVVTVMDPENYDQLEISASLFGDLVPFLEDSIMVKLDYAGDEIVSARLPQKLTAEITETEPVLKNAAINPSYKDAVLHNGFKIKVPPYIAQGTKIVINSETMEFLEKLKD